MACISARIGEVVVVVVEVVVVVVVYVACAVALRKNRKAKLGLGWEISPKLGPPSTDQATFYLGEAYFHPTEAQVG